MKRALIGALLALTFSPLMTHPEEGRGPSRSVGAEEEIRRLEQQWLVAYLTGDRALFDRLVADEGALPLFVYDGATGFPLAAWLRPGTAHAALGAVDSLRPVVEALRRAWPGVLILLRGDSGLAVPAVYEYCEAQGLLYCLGFAANAVLHSASRGKTFTVRAGIFPGYAWVEVEDLGGPWLCRQRDCRPHGLHIVTALVGDSWGTETASGGCRVTWARVSFHA